ncbi:hypothetical protein GMORB2_4320 [Geosmithia morbida]|uniref:LYR motif-containing protein Cup1-like N-terminal domain-containing protein n=1 Tax=Geosmithia morbida TaxID=1094350 RepID=A0A9P5D766_9HYPO|nr:uncharacterized protein GMORB2_4320 [Geosmithia morbida]KAF4125480.1 hypothetical protein GMORB2_4320 [Geosmithia morbida]
MPPSTSIPGKSPLHIYRHLLREISYLPPAFSSTISDQVRHQFHQHANSPTHAKLRLSRARAGLRTIMAANRGDTDCMTRLMAKGFGREGKRRRQLVSEFVVSQGVGDSSSLEKMLEAATVDDDGVAATTPDDARSSTKKRKDKNAFLDRWDRPKLLQFLKTQQRAQNETKTSVIWGGSPIKTVDDMAGIPATNSWGKPPSETLVRAKQAKWWKRHADKIMPPIDKGEWQLLQRLSDGAQSQRGSEWAIPPRRTPAVSLSGPVEEDTKSRLDASAFHSAAFVDRPRTVRLRRYTGESRDAGPYTGKPHRDTISDRWFRRAYRRVWRKTSYAEMDANTLKYTFTWGKASSTSLPPPSPTQSTVFDGVDDNGQPKSA